MRSRIVFVAIAVTLSCCSKVDQTRPSRDSVSADSNKATFRSAIAIWAAGDISAIDQVTGPQYVGHVSTGDRDRQGLRERIEAFQRLYSSVAFHVEDQPDGDKVVTRLSADLTRRDTGKSVKLIGINISRFADGKIIEEWNTWEPVRHRESDTLTPNQSMKPRPPDHATARNLASEHAVGLSLSR